MKKGITKLLTIFIALSFTTTVFSQNISLVTIPNGPTDCTNTIVDVNATQLCINYIYNGYTTAITGNTITIELVWTNASPICLGALAFISENVNLGQLAAGSYSVEVKGIFNGGQQSIMTQTMTITSCCAVTSVVQGQTNICLGESALLINNSTNATSSYWAQGTTVLSTNDSLPLTFTMPGTYAYELVATDGSCNASTTHTVTVSDYPTVDLGADTTVCSGQAVLLDASSPGATSYSWSTGNPGSTLNVTLPGTYSVVVSNNGCTDSDTVVVGSIASPVFDLGVNMAFCQGDSTILDATVNGAGVTYIWSTGNTTPTLTVTTSNTYSVTVTNSVNCSVDDIVSITVEALPMPNLGPDTTLCTGSLVLSDLANSSNNYVWSTGEGMSTITIDSAGTYAVTSTSDNGCVGTDEIIVDYDVPVLNLGGTIDLVNASPVILDAENTGSTYSWNTGETTQTISVDTIGTYSVTVTNSAGCAVIGSVTVVNTTNTNGIKLAKIKVFPNPAADYIIIENSAMNLQTARITNAFGQIVKQVDIQQNQKVAVQDLTSGFYFIQFENTDGQVVGTTRFIKQ
jgi:hypothetical protein